MKILAIDSTAKTAAAAVTDDEKLIASFVFNGTLTHSQTLLPMIKSVLDISGITVSDIDAFACSAGPGSFTGVRIGVSAIKGLAFSSGKPCIGVSTLEALAENIAPLAGGSIICPVMDARRNQVYNALFCEGKRLTDDRAISIEELRAELEAYAKPFYLVGDGYDVTAGQIDSPLMCAVPENLRCQNAYSVSMVALKKFRAFPDGDYSDSSLSPVYLRPSQAERERDERISKE